MLSEEHAVLILQRWFRALLWRKKYAITRASDSDLTDNKTFLVGNDPHISGLEGFNGATPSVLVATLGLRALEVICALNQQSHHIPKLIIVDNLR